MKQNLKIEPTLLPAFSAFECVARHASFTRAAAELGVSASALSQSVRTLEQRLGVRLLTRTTRSVSLTDEGERFYDGVRIGLDEFSAALEGVAASRGRASGTLRINMPRPAYRVLIAPHLAGFSVRHPDVKLEFALDDGFADIVAGRFDAGMRMSEAIEADMVAVRLGGPNRMITVAAPDYLARRPAPLSVDDLGRHECVSYRFASSGRTMRWMFQREGRPLEVEVDARYIVNDAEVEIDLARRGLAMVQTLESLVSDDLAQGRLCAVLSEHATPMSAIHLYFPSRAQMPQRLRVFIDYFQQANEPAVPETASRLTASVG
ncbi:LysR family transcriptional regulator [Methyloversatilis thermotolerans]|uniref:LysR family transcriptional regulator n=1 Tax=Methyloversatilis thermotolerans TaxID=1346290 RepID=UPI00058F080F|nr:LysR family transcriptional regulator [Methyloversatilis thermotolerans]